MIATHQASDVLNCLPTEFVTVQVTALKDSFSR